MEEVIEKRGPIEKTKKGWPINPFGVVVLTIFALIIIFLIVKPLLTQKVQPNIQVQTVSPGGSITTPQAGDIIRTPNLDIEVAIDEPQKVAKVEFWAKTYADGKWEMIGEATTAPYKLNWQISPQFQNKAVAITTHITQTDGNTIKDPGGWREGIIILSQ